MPKADKTFAKMLANAPALRQQRARKEVERPAVLPDNLGIMAIYVAYDATKHANPDATLLADGGTIVGYAPLKVKDVKAGTRARKDGSVDSWDDYQVLTDHSPYTDLDGQPFRASFETTARFQY